MSSYYSPSIKKDTMILEITEQLRRARRKRPGANVSHELGDWI